MNADVVVIGGGVVGASAAYHLARAGARVTLVDRADAGQATAAGAGIIAPGTSLRPLPAFYPFGYAAARAYPGLIANLAEDGEPETGFAVVGLLFVATTDDEAARLPETVALFRSRAAEDPTVGEVAALSGAEARALFPPLADVPAALRVSGAARVDGRLLRDALRGAAARRGATIIHGDAIPQISAGRVTGVQVGDQRIAADALVVAGGAWSNAIGDALGVRLPTEPQRGQILHLRLRGTRTAGWPIVIGFHGSYLLTFPEERVVAGATRETGSGYAPWPTAGGVHSALGEALRLAPGLAGATLDEVRVGLRPASPDGLPMLSAVPGLANVWAATGHGPSGLQLGPFSGAVVADLVLGRAVAVDLGAFGVGRFAQSASGVRCGPRGGQAGAGRADRGR